MPDFNDVTEQPMQQVFRAETVPQQSNNIILIAYGPAQCGKSTQLQRYNRQMCAGNAMEFESHLISYIASICNNVRIHEKHFFIFKPLNNDASIVEIYNLLQTLENCGFLGTLQDFENLFQNLDSYDCIVVRPRNQYCAIISGSEQEMHVE